MKKFLLDIIKYCIPLTLIILALTLIWFILYPAVGQVSNSMSYNAKIDFLKNSYANKKIEILTLGSSLSLCNLDPAPLLNFFNTDRYLNLSSWGLNMRLIYENILYFNPMYSINTLIICAGLEGFDHSKINVNFKKLDHSLKARDKDFSLPDLSDFSFSSFKQSYQYKKLKLNSFDYRSLSFDNYGTVILPKKGFKISRIRWLYGHRSIRSRLDSLDSNQFKYLDSIAGFCLKNNIQLIYINAPYRAGYLSKIESSTLDQYEHVLIKIDSILKRNKSINIKAQDKIWPDSLFNDVSHMNNVGALQLSNFIVDQLTHN